MTKLIFSALILALWAGYAAQGDRKSVPDWYHPATHLLYAGLLVAVVAWI